MGSLYVVGGPAGDPSELTRRALRILRDVALVVADDLGPAQRLLAHHGITTPLMACEGTAPLDALKWGDVVLLFSGWSPAPGASGSVLVSTAARRGFSVVSVPGPALPVTALVLSGFPADRFVCLGELPQQHSARRDLLTSIASERRTIVVVELPSRLPTIVTELLAVLGDRSLVVLVASGQGTEAVWRGTLDQVPSELGQELPLSHCALVIAGRQEEPPRWAEDRLRNEITRLRAQGLGSKEISQKLAAESGWLRREIYRLAVETVRIGASNGKRV